MTPEDYEQSLDRLSEGRRLFEEVVVSALKAGIAAAESEASALSVEVADLKISLKRERAQHEPERDRLVATLKEERLEATKSAALLREVEKELAVVKRDRDALIQRAQTAEQTLVNHGIDLRTMERKTAEQRWGANPSFQDGRDQPPGRYTRLNGTPLGEVRPTPPFGGSGQSLETGAKIP